jgi:hypothetical protein
MSSEAAEGSVPTDQADAPASGAADESAFGRTGQDVPAVITDPKAMRALAHPVRMALLELFSFHETVTATEASEALGESPANCAFHLRTLAKYGFVAEAGGGRGRERPWRMVNRSLRLTTNQPDPQARVAADELGRVMLERWMDRARRTYGIQAKVPGWEHATSWSRDHVFLTAEETEKLMGEVLRLFHPYAARLTDPSQRPPGARPVEWSIFSAPELQHAEPDPEPDPDPAQ